MIYSRKSTIMRLFLIAVLFILCISTGLKVRADEPSVTPNENETTVNPDWMEPTEPDIIPTPVTKPDVVQNLKWENIGDTKIKFSWSALYYNVDGYQISIYDPETKKYTVARSISGSDSREATVKNLKPGTKYKVAIRAYVKANNQKYYGKYSEKLTVKTAPKAIALKKVSYSSKGTLTVKWQKSSNADGYVLQYSTSKKFKNDGHTTSILIKKGSTVSKKISGLAQTTYYVRVAAGSKNGNYCCTKGWSKTMKVSVKQGLTLKELLNKQKSDMSSREDILYLTNNGVDIKKYSNTYDRVRAIFHWHAVHSKEFGSCLNCNANFNDCLFALFGYSSELTLWIAGDTYINNSGSRVMHKWSTVYLQGIPFYFDPRMQGTMDSSGYSYFGFRPNSSLFKKHYVFEGWFMCTNEWHYY